MQSRYMSTIQIKMLQWRRRGCACRRYRFIIRPADRHLVPCFQILANGKPFFDSAVFHMILDCSRNLERMFRDAL